MSDYQVSNRRACAVVLLGRSTWHYKARRRDDSVLRRRIREIAASAVRPNQSSLRLSTHFYLTSAGGLRTPRGRDNHKRVHRLYRLEGLNLRSKRPRRNRTAAHRLDRPELSTIYQCWSMDFVADQLFDGRKIRALTIVDNFSRQCVAIHVGQSLKGEDVVAVMNHLKVVDLAVPERIQQGRLSGR